MRRQRIAQQGAILAVVLAMAALAFVVTGVFRPGAAHAQAAIQAGLPGIISKDPTGITFTLRVTATGGLKSARFEYSVFNADGGNVGGAGDATVAPIADNDLSFTLSTRDNQRYIPVGSIFKYHWRLTANDGTVLDTPEQEYVFLDGRYQWVSRQDGPVTVYFYGGNEASALAALRAAHESLDSTGKLLEATVPYPIRLVVYKSEDEGKLAMRQQSASFDAQVLTGGQRVSPDLILVFQNSPDVVRHETGHIVTHVAGDGPFTRLPSWLDEGVAVYEQPDPGPGYSSGLQLAIRSDHTVPLRSMQSAPTKPELVDIFYGQSWSTVKYLIDTYGQPKFAELFRVINRGSRTDDALKQVYGFDQDGLYNEWRAKNGLKPVAVSAAASGGSLPAAEATRAPLGIPSGGSVVAAAAPTAEASGSGADTSGGGSRAGVMVLVGAVVVAGALGGGGVMLLRKPKSSAAPPPNE
jgi:hypothetical protein